MRARARRFRSFCLVPLQLVCLLGLAACASRPVPPDETERQAAWQLHQARLGDIRSWQLKGRVAVQTGSDAWSASLHWQQEPQQYLLRLIAPLGRGTYELRGTPAGVSLRGPDNELLTAPDPETLMTRSLGWYLPVSGLYYWVRGLPEPLQGVQEMTLDAQGRLLGLQQDGWTIDYSQYQPRAGYELPTRIELQGRQLKVRLLLRDWQPGL